MVFLEKIKRWLISEEIEHRLFIITLVLAIPYFLASILFDVLKSEPTLFLVIDCSFLFLSLAFLLLRKKTKIRPVLIAVFCALITVGFFFFWNISGGIRGGAPYIFFVLSSLLILMNKGGVRNFYTITSIVLVFALTSELVTVSGEITYDGLLFDFTLNFIILSFLLMIFKLALDKEQKELTIQNDQIIEVNGKLKQKSDELEDYNLQIESIKNNLELIVEERTAKLDLENKKDIEYAFINAHLVRAPIANMLAVIQLTENQNSDMHELKANVSNLDNTLRDIARVLSE